MHKDRDVPSLGDLMERVPARPEPPKRSTYLPRIEKEVMDTIIREVYGTPIKNHVLRAPLSYATSTGGAVFKDVTWTSTAATSSPTYKELVEMEKADALPALDASRAARKKGRKRG